MSKPSIIKRSWTNKSGRISTSYRLRWKEPDGKRRSKDFTLRKDAEAERLRTEIKLAEGVYISDRNSLTLKAAAASYLRDFEELCRQGKREYSTHSQYRQHIEIHIENDPIHGLNLTQITPILIGEYIRRLEQQKSDAMARAIFFTLKAIFDYSKSKGWTSGNPAKGLKLRAKGKRHRKKIEIPSKTDLAALLTAAGEMDDGGRALAIIVTLIFAGMRTSELRGLRIQDVDFRKMEIRIRQRADRWQRIGVPKTKNGNREIAMTEELAVILREWILKAPKGDLRLVFPNGAGNVESHGNIWNRVFRPVMAKAKLVDTIFVENSDSKPAIQYTPRFNLKSLRHTAVSIWIEQGFSAKRISAWAGHGSIAFTQDTYGHLWPETGDDRAMLSSAYHRVLRGE